MKSISQKTIVRMMETFKDHNKFLDYSRLLYEHDFPDWFGLHTGSHYLWDWDDILRDLASGRFFQAPYTTAGVSISGGFFDVSEAKA